MRKLEYCFDMIQGIYWWYYWAQTEKRKEKES